MEKVGITPLESSNIIICLPKMKDIAQIKVLHNAYLFENIGEHETKEGFIKVKYSEADFEEVIKFENMVIAKQLNNIIGYYCLGCCTSSTYLEYQREVLSKLKYKGYLLQNLNIGYGAQSVVKKEFRGLKINSFMLQSLISKVKHKYDFLFSSISKINEQAKVAHSKEGYVIVGEDEAKYFVLYELKS
jgi:hypothetical protein